MGPELGEHVFRRERAALVASLTRLLGSRHLELAEDVAQEALVRAAREWPFRGIPESPAAWLRAVAKNLAIDVLRREARGLELLEHNAAFLRSEWTMPIAVDEALQPQRVADDELRMLFACCSPRLPLEQQVTLALKTLSGLTVRQIARAFLTTEETIQKRLLRARDVFRAHGKIELPAEVDLTARLDGVLAVIYLTFNEGYYGADTDQVIRDEVLEEALRLGDLVVQEPTTDVPEARALLGLMLLHAARSPARMAGGEIVLLRDQDRKLWDTHLIGLAKRHLDRAIDGPRLTAYHVEAAIAAAYTLAPSYDAIDWDEVVALYDQLLRIKPGPVVALSRAIAVGEARGPSAGLEALRDVPDTEASPILHAARGDLLARAGAWDDAAAAFRAAKERARSGAERSLLARKLARARARGAE